MRAFHYYATGLLLSLNALFFSFAGLASVELGQYDDAILFYAFAVLAGICFVNHVFYSED